MGLFASEDERAAKKARAAEAKFQASPVGQAIAAFERGDSFFQTRVTEETIKSSVMSPPGRNGSTNNRSTFTSTDVLGQIEEVGWRLEHASWVYVQTGQNTANKTLSEGQWVNVSGEVIGVYLFRRVGSANRN
jgi:hypothetical protein